MPDETNQPQEPKVPEPAERRSVLGFGHLLKEERTIVPIDKAAVSRDQQNKSHA
jgi:hypothetical protein